MKTEIPTATEVQSWLLPLTHAQVQALAEVSEVPFTTLWKVRNGETGNPRIETVRKIAQHIKSAAD